MLICPASVLCILGPDLEDALGEGFGVDLGLFEFVFVSSFDVSLIVLSVFPFGQLVWFVVWESFCVCYFA